MLPKTDALTAALESLPHGPNFRFVDRMVTLTPGRHGTGEYRIRGDESFLRGHFPGNPMMPGVLLIEAAAQLAGMVAQSDPAVTPIDSLKLTAVRSAKILGTALPGELLQLEARIVGRMGSLVQAEAAVSVRGRQLVQTSLVLGGAQSAS